MSVVSHNGILHSFNNAWNEPFARPANNANCQQECKFVAGRLCQPENYICFNCKGDKQRPQHSSHNPGSALQAVDQWTSRSIHFDLGKTAKDENQSADRPKHSANTYLQAVKADSLSDLRSPVPNQPRRKAGSNRRDECRDEIQTSLSFEPSIEQK